MTVKLTASSNVNDYKVVAFHHIPRTGGAALLKQLYSEPTPEPWRLRSVSVFEPLDRLQEVCSLSSEKIFAHSHDLFGLHCIIDAKIGYFSLVREPVDQTVSLFFWQSGIEILRADMTRIYDAFDAYLSKFGHLNYQLLKLALPAQSHPVRSVMLNLAHPENFKSDVTQLYRAAIKNIIDHFIFIAATSNTSEYYAFLENSFGFQKLSSSSVAFRNTSCGSSKLSETFIKNMPLTLRRKLENMTEGDREIYNAFHGPKSSVLPRRVEASQVIANHNAPVPEHLRFHPGVPWDFAIEGLVQLGALASDFSQSSNGLNWSLKIPAPLSEPVTTALKVLIKLTPTKGLMPKYTVWMRLEDAKSDRAELARLAPETLNCVVPEQHITDGVATVMIHATTYGSESVQTNILPYLIQEIVLTSLSTYRLGDEIRFGADMPNILLDGWNAPHPQFVWTLRRQCRLVLVTDSAHLLSHAVEEDGEITLSLEIELAPLLQPGFVEHQRMFVSVNGHDIGYETVREHCRIHFDFSMTKHKLRDNAVIIGLELPDATTLAALGLGRDDSNDLGVMVFALRLSSTSQPVGPCRIKGSGVDDALARGG